MSLFAFEITYTRIHLAVEAHLDDTCGSFGHGESYSGVDDETDHTPHPASDHYLNFTTQVQVSRVAAATTAYFLAPDVSSFLFEPESLPRIPIFEHLRPPGESPPDPQQPRAPPLG